MQKNVCVKNVEKKLGNMSQNWPKKKQNKNMKSEEGTSVEHIWNKQELCYG